MNLISDEDLETKYTCLDYDSFDSIPQLVDTKHAEQLFMGIQEYGFNTPSTIQSKAIPAIIDGHDLIAQSRSGTGKTGAFVISALAKINVENKNPQVIIIANNKSLVEQIHSVACEISNKMNIKITLCIGGIDDGKNTSYNNFKDASESHILIGTPGRLNDIIERSKYTNEGNQRWKMTNSVNMIIIDEADELLKPAFQNDIISILERLKKTTQICTFSATYNIEIAKNYLNIMNKKNVVQLLIDDSDVKINSIKNYVLNLEEDLKFNTLLDLFKRVTICQCVIFVNKVQKAIDLGNALKSENYCISVMHRDLTEAGRRDTMKNFRNGTSRILVSTDIISRGIDIEQVGLVINYDIPNTPEQYIHRVGRSGRYGKTGVAINFRTSSDIDKINMENVVRIYGIEIIYRINIAEITGYLSGPKGYNYKNI